MGENFSEKLADREKNQVGRLPLEFRNPFQVEVFKILIADKMLGEKDMDEMSRYSRVISDFIDNPENVGVRELILQKKFKEAAEIMLAEIQREEDLPHAA